MKRVALVLSAGSTVLVSILGGLVLALLPPRVDVPERSNWVFRDVTLVEPGRAPRPRSALRIEDGAITAPVAADSGSSTEFAEATDLAGEAVLADGRLYRRAELDAMLAAADAHFHGSLYSGVMDAVVAVAQGRFAPDHDGTRSFGGQP